MINHTRQTTENMLTPVNLNRPIAVSGASSFTGFWIACALKEAGWQVHTLFTQQSDSYSGIRAERVRILQKNTHCHFKIAAHDGSMLSWIQTHPVDIWIHHHHWMEKFKLPEYDLDKANLIGRAPLPELVRSLSLAGCLGIIHSCTYFEQAGSLELPPNSRPYVNSKIAVRQLLTRLCLQHRIPISNIFIPNPVGPLDNEDRFFTRLIESIRSKQEFKLLHPELKTSIMAVEELSAFYVRAAEVLLQGKSLDFHPQGVSLTVAEWAEKIRNEYEEKWKRCTEGFPETPTPLTTVVGIPNGLHSRPELT